MNNLKLTAVQNARNKLQNLASDIFFYLGQYVNHSKCPVVRGDYNDRTESAYDRCQTIYESCEAKHYILSNQQRNTIQALAELYCASHDVFTNGDTDLEEVTESIKITMLLYEILRNQNEKKAQRFSLN
ncbi:MAG: hypothetical protein RL662_1412 [Bacteroidota bacterium]